MPTAFPSYLQNQPQVGELQQAYRSIPGAFDTSGYESNVRNMSAMDLAQGKASVGAMARAAENRATQGGGKVQSSFAAGSALLPYFQQQQSQMADLQDYKLRAAQSALAARTSIGGALAGYRQGAQGNMLNYDLAGQARQQQGGQFGQNLAQQAAQFSAENALRTRQQDFSERQYADQLQLQRSGGGRMGASYGGGQQLPAWGNVAAIMGASNSALGSPSAANYWNQLGTAARQGGFDQSQVFGTGSRF